MLHAFPPYRVEKLVKLKAYALMLQKSMLKHRKA